jgi:hypothetical protein
MPSNRSGALDKRVCGASSGQESRQAWPKAAREQRRSSPPLKSWAEGHRDSWKGFHRKEQEVNLSETVLQFVRANYVHPARLHGVATIEVKAGDIHRGLRWSRRVPLVCSALSSQKFQNAVGVKLIGTKDAPPSGLSTRTIYRYEILDQETPSGLRTDPPAPKRGLLAAYGVAAHLYRQVGGGDAFLRAERENFGSTVPESNDANVEPHPGGATNP